MASPVVVVGSRSRLIVSKERGPQGPTGVGVPVGGTAGQVLSKIDATNFNTSWIDMTGGGGTTLASLTDTTISLVAAGEVLVWDSISSAWINQLLSEAGIAALSHTHTLSQISDSGSAAALDVAVAGDAGVGEVVKGNDTRLSDARTAVAHTHPFTQITGTLADAQVVVGNVTQHQAALTLAWSQITSGVPAFLLDLSAQSTTNLAEGTNLYFTSKRVDDRVAALLVAGTNITLAYDNVANSLTVSSVDTNTDTLAALTDTSIVGVAGGHILQWDGVTSKWVNLTLTAAGIAAAVHTHAASEVISGAFADLRISQTSVTQHQAALAIAWGQLTGVPTTFAPAAHTHGAADITTGELNTLRVPVMLAASGFSNGQRGAVPTPLIADAGKFLNAAAQWATPTDTNTQRLAEIRATVDGGGAATTAVTIKGYVEEACTITAASIVADVSGSIIVTVKRDRATVIAVLGTITLTAATTVRSAPTGWTTTDLAVGDILIFEFGTGTTLTRATVTLGRTAV